MGKGDVRYLNIETVAKQLGVHPETVRLWCRKGKLPSKRDRLSQGRPFMVEQQDVIDFKEAMQQ